MSARSGAGRAKPAYTKLKVRMTVGHNARTCAQAMARSQRRATVSDGSASGVQAGGPVGVRAVPTALRWNTSLGSPPGTIAATGAHRGWSAACPGSGALSAEVASAVSSSGRRDNMPVVSSWDARTPVGGFSPSAWPLTSGLGSAAGAVSSIGREGLATDAIARMPANQAASHRSSIPPRCARAPTGTSVVSHARSDAARSRRQSAAAKDGRSQ
jgi:hypothetical protein